MRGRLRMRLDENEERRNIKAVCGWGKRQKEKVSRPCLKSSVMYVQGVFLFLCV